MHFGGEHLNAVVYQFHFPKCICLCLGILHSVRSFCCEGTRIQNSDKRRGLVLLWSSMGSWELSSSLNNQFADESISGDKCSWTRSAYIHIMFGHVPNFPPDT